MGEVVFLFRKAKSCGYHLSAVLRRYAIVKIISSFLDQDIPFISVLEQGLWNASSLLVDITA